MRQILRPRVGKLHIIGAALYPLAIFRSWMHVFAADGIITERPEVDAVLRSVFYLLAHDSR